MLRALVVVGRIHEGKRLSGVYVSGRDGVYSDILSLIGAQNVSSHQTVALPTLSPEGLFALGPEAILEIRSLDDRVVDTKALAAFWQRYQKIPAIAEGRFAILSEDYASIPGPRYLLLAERFARVIYPERF
jgi:ABC-type Fe3+-hydroxamate transport system substrate-binding protein